MHSLRFPLLVVLLTMLFAAHARALVFEENRGQAPPNVRFVAHRGGTSVAIEDDAFSILTGGSDWLRLSFAGVSPCANVQPLRRLSAHANYFVGNDPAQWVTDVPMWEGVAIRGLYPGIDVQFREARGGLEYDFVVAPGADPDLIAMRTDGSLRLVEHEGVLIASHDGIEAFRQLPPLAFQSARIIESAIQLEGEGIHFAHSSFDPRLELVIDPVIVFSTYAGGSSGDQAHAITVDAAGNTYIAGATYSSNYPLRDPFQSTNKSTPSERDAFVTKLDASGQVVFSTYFGGTRGRDLAEAVAVDASGAVYFAGTTYSLDLPVSSNAFQKTANQWVGDDGFLAKLVPAGNALAYATYLAAMSDVPSTEFIRAILVDRNGNAIVTGDTSNATWPVTPGAYRTTG